MAVPPFVEPLPGVLGPDQPRAMAAVQVGHRYPVGAHAHTDTYGLAASLHLPTKDEENNQSVVINHLNTQGLAARTFRHNLSGRHVSDVTIRS